LVVGLLIRNEVGDAPAQEGIGEYIRKYLVIRVALSIADSVVIETLE